MNPHILYHMVVMVPRASIRSESEVSITVLCLQCSPHYTAVRIKNHSKSMPVNKGSRYEKYNGVMCPSYRLKLKYPFPFPVSYVQLVTQYESINNCLKSTPVIKVATMKNTDDLLGTISVT